jgi:hypothetical protein
MGRSIGVVGSGCCEGGIDETHGSLACDGSDGQATRQVPPCLRCLHLPEVM